MNWREITFALLLGFIGAGLAAYIGWRYYLENPEGVFPYTPRDWCNNRTHSFSIAYLLVLFVAGLTSLLVALIAWVASLVRSLSNSKGNLVRVARICVMAALAFTFGAVLNVGFEAGLPLRKDHRCVQTAP